MPDATWKQHPSDNDFDNPANWSTAAVPQDADTAFFGPSKITSLAFSESTDIGGWSFAANAASYTFTIAADITLNFEAAGITGKSGGAHIVNNGRLGLFNEAKAGHAHITNNLYFSFHDDSSADHATINAKHEIDFFDDSGAGNAKITNNSFLSFNGNSSADHATITTAAGHNVGFFGTSDGDSASFVTQKGGYVDFTQSTGHGNFGIHSAGSIAGAGDYIFNDIFFVGGNNRSTKVSGLLTDNNTGAKLVKFGTGTLTLAHDHNHFSSAEIDAGTLDIAALSAAGLGEITFAPPSAGNETLKLENAALSHHDFNSNQIVDFGLAHEAIDLAGLKFVAGAKATLDSNVLTVKSGGVKDTLTLVSAQTDEFKAVNDGHGGTKIVAKVTHEKAIASAHAAHAEQHDVLHASGEAPFHLDMHEIGEAEGLLL